jgi:formiminoglutamase
MKTKPIEIKDFFQSSNPLEDPRFCDNVVTNVADVPSIVIVGCPQDIGVQRNNGRVGAAEAPNSIRKQFYKLTPYSFGKKVHDFSHPIVDIGNIDTASKTLEHIHTDLSEVVEQLISKGDIPIVLGGGHDCAFANGSAMLETAKKQGKTVSIINIDAHLDVRPLNNGVAHSGSPFRQLLENYPKHIAHFYEFGIQNFSYSHQHIQYLESSHVPTTIFFYDEIVNLGLQTALQQFIQSCQESKADWIYLSIDIDAVQSAYAPGVSAPAVVGFTPNELLQIVQQICTTKKVRLVDIVEVNPTYDIDNRTSKLAAITMATAITALD